MNKMLLYAVAVLIVPGILVLEAVAVVNLWRWFVIPLWPMMPVLSIPQAMGIGLIPALLTTSQWRCRPLTGVESMRYVGVLLSRPLVVLIVGYIIKEAAL